MDDSTYTLVSTGLLGVIALLLIFVVARLARVERALKDRPEDQPLPEAPSVDGAVAAAIAEPSEPPALQQSGDDGGEAPFEKDGRWWYRQGDELLVYNEQTESWVLPDAPAPVTEPAEIEPHPLDEARGWDTAPQEPTTVPEDISPATVPEDVSPAPIPEPVSAPEPITETEPEVVTPATEPKVVTAETSEPETTEQPSDTPAAGAHWKCPACGVINGSTATSCRMCFAARP